MVSLVSKAQQPLAGTVALTGLGRKRAPKLRRGGQQVIPTIAELASKYQLGVPGVSVDDMQSLMLHGERLRKVLGVVATFQKILEDAIMTSEGTSWQFATAFYTVLRRAAKHRPEMDAELAPIVAWFRSNRTGGKKSKSSQPSNGAPAPSTTNGASAPATNTNGVTAPSGSQPQ